MAQVPESLRTLFISETTLFGSFTCSKTSNEVILVKRIASLKGKKCASATTLGFCQHYILK